MGFLGDGTFRSFLSIPSYPDRPACNHILGVMLSKTSGTNLGLF